MAYLKTDRTMPAWHLDSLQDDSSSNNSYRPRSLLGRISLNLSPITALWQRKPYNYEYHAAPTDDDLRASGLSLNGRRTTSKWSRLLWRVAYTLPIVILSLLGLLHVILVVLGSKRLFWDVNVDENVALVPEWVKYAQDHAGQLHYPTDATRDVTPIPCHSHNDYWRPIPLFDAIRWGCTSVEADVWLFDGEKDLFVGHNTASLTRDRTFASLYVDPLVELLDAMNQESTFSRGHNRGVFDKDPNQTLILLVDFKTDGRDLYPHVLQQLEPLRSKGYLSYWDGETIISRAITVVGTGNTPFDLITAEHTNRDIFFDAPLDRMWEAPSQQAIEQHQHQGSKRTPGQGNTGIGHITSPDDFNATNSYYASVSFLSTIGLPWTGRLTDAQLERIRGQIRGAQRRGLKARYWDTPAWPTSLRNYVWRVLVEEGADMLNVDDLRAAAALDWTVPVGHAWIDA